MYNHNSKFTTIHKQFFTTMDTKANKNRLSDELDIYLKFFRFNATLFAPKCDKLEVIFVLFLLINCQTSFLIQFYVY